MKPLLEFGDPEVLCIQVEAMGDGLCLWIGCDGEEPGEGVTLTSEQEAALLGVLVERAMAREKP